MSATVGAGLAAKRGERGLTIEQVYFTGVDIKITSGKAAATLITIDGRPIGALGTGVATREFTSQTST